MTKKIFVSLVILVTLLFLSSNHVKGEENFVYEIIKLDQYKVRFDDCNTTLVYWASDLKGPFNAIEEILHKTKLLDEKYIELFKINYTEVHKINDEKGVSLYPIPDEIYDKIFSELKIFKTELATKYGILTEGSVVPYFPFRIQLGVYKLDEDKIKIINSLIVPLIEKLNQQYLSLIINTYGDNYRLKLVYYYESYSPDAFKEKQAQAFKKFFDYYSENNSYGMFGDGYREYASLLKKYYNIDKPFGYGYSYTSGEARLYVPYNAPFNEQFVKEAVNLIRKYTGCDIPLILSFRPDPELAILPVVIPNYIFLALAVATIVTLIIVTLKLNTKKSKDRLF